MKWYCSKCKKMHEEEELCPRFKQQLKDHPELLTEIANFTTVAGQHYLITSQALDEVAKGINKVAGTQLSYEGTHQFARDIQVFKRLSEEPFARSGVFASPENAKAYLDNVKKIAETKPGALTSFESKLTGYGQEVDWLRMKQGEISSLWQKSSLLNDNAAGIDGTTINRFTGKEISRTTIKASKNQMTSNSTAIRDVKEAIEKGTATEKDIIFGPKGTAEAAKKAGLKNPVVEKNTAEQIKASNQRLVKKIDSGEAFTNVTAQELGKKMAQGAIVGAVVSVTISSITNYMRYKNGELTREEVFREVSEETVKGAITGAATSVVSTLFLPAGPLGFIAGIGVGIYFNKACTNILDEIYGKGAYGAILDASGYVYGMTFNLAEYYEKIEKNNKITRKNIVEAEKIQQRIDRNFDIFEQMKGE